MNTTIVKTQSKARVAYQEFLKFKEKWEMEMAKVNMRLHETIATRTPVKLLGGLALGALLVTAAILPFGTTYADEPAKPLSSEQIEVLPEFLQTEVWLPGDAYPAARGRTEDMPEFLHTEVWLPDDTYPASAFSNPPRKSRDRGLA